MNKLTYYTTLPYQVRLDSRLCPFARLLYGEIVALSRQTGYCWASNTFFAQLYQVREKAVSRWLRELRQNGYIRVEVAKGNQRKIYPSDLPKAAAQNGSSDAPIAGGTPALSKGVADLREGVGPPLGEAKTAVLLSNKNNNITEYIQGTPPFWEMDKREEGVSEKAVLRLSAEESPPPNPPAAAVPLPPVKNSAPSPFVKPSVKEAEDYMLSQKELCPSVLTARALRFINYYESNGWKVGRNAMQDWQAAANNWLLNAQTYDTKNSRTHANSRLHSPGNGRIDYSIPL